MDEKQFSVIVLTLKSVYSYSGFLETPQAIKIWYETLKDINYEVMNKVVAAYIASESKTPTPADLRKKAMEILTADDMSEMEAWAIVSKALRDSTYHAKERFDEFPEKIKKAVGSAEVLRAWGQDDNYCENVAQSHFIKVYRTVTEREKTQMMIPENVRKAITSALNPNLALETKD